MVGSHSVELGFGNNHWTRDRKSPRKTFNVALDYLNLPFCGIGFVTILVVGLKQRKATFEDKLLRVEWVGGTLFIAILTSFLIAVSRSGIQFPWDSCEQ
jgi:hypothetical protein